MRIKSGERITAQVYFHISGSARIFLVLLPALWTAEPMSATAADQGIPTQLNGNEACATLRVADPQVQGVLHGVGGRFRHLGQVSSIDHYSTV